MPYRILIPALISAAALSYPSRSFGSETGQSGQAKGFRAQGQALRDEFRDAIAAYRSEASKHSLDSVAREKLEAYARLEAALNGDDAEALKEAVQAALSVLSERGQSQPSMNGGGPRDGGLSGLQEKSRQLSRLSWRD